jgi:hypothetical protein
VGKAAAGRTRPMGQNVTNSINFHSAHHQSRLN